MDLVTMDPIKMAYIEGLMLDISELEAEKLKYENDLIKWQELKDKEKFKKIESSLTNKIDLIDEDLENKRAELREL